MPRLLPLLLLLAPVLSAAEIRVPILAYHQVQEVPRAGWSVSVENFTDQMRFLRAAGYHVVPIAALYDSIAGRGGELPPNPVVITVDDGFADAYTNIRPILAKFAMPWSLYIYPNFIGHGADALNWPQVVELSNAGVDVESHTVHHPHLMHRSHPEMSDAEYASWLHAELAGSKATIEARTHKPIRFLSYPYGDYDQTIEHEAAADGYVAALTSWAGFNTEKTKPLELRRIPIESDTTLDAFARGVGAVPLQLSGVSPAAETVATPAAVSATIVQHGELDPATVQIALLGESGAGSYDPATGRVTVTLRKPSRPRQQVIVYGQRLSDRRPMAAAWTFYTSTAAKSRYDAIAQRLHELPLHHTQAKRQ